MLTYFELLIHVFYRDNVQWDAEQEKAAQEKVEQNSLVTFSEDILKDLDQNADKHWDDFYDIHQNRLIDFVKSPITSTFK